MVKMMRNYRSSTAFDIKKYDEHTSAIAGITSNMPVSRALEKLRAIQDSTYDLAKVQNLGLFWSKPAKIQ
jgi:hypothetical protein